MAYDNDNIFAKILRGEIPCNKLLETEHSLAFHDINPQTPVHVLIVPKGAYVNLDDFSANASDAEIADFMRAVGEVARQTDVVDSGYRFLSNAGADAFQEVPHFHVHVFGGKPLGRMIKPPDK